MDHTKKMWNVTVTSSSGFKKIECLLFAVAASIPDFTAAPNDMHGDPWDLMSLYDTEKLGFEVTSCCIDINPTIHPIPIGVCPEIGNLSLISMGISGALYRPYIW